MKVIVAGSRYLSDRHYIKACIANSGLVGEMTELVHGGCCGVDSVAHDLFEGVLPIKVFPANWDKHGKAAGPIRNREMAQYADALIAIYWPDSRGTKNMIKEMEKLGKTVKHFMLTAQASSNSGGFASGR